MRQDLRLYIAGKEVEFNQSPEILYNYTETDSTNPSVVKNSYSKSITISGTSSNNDLFGHIWDLERYQQHDASGFNPLQKADFTLYLNGEIYESGYAKLDEVRRTGANIEYSITLYGGLGSFFYNLSYAHNEEGEADGPNKLELSDLAYEEDFNTLSINKDTIWDAWQTIIGGNGDIACDTEEEVAARGGRPNVFLFNHLWRDTINFAPCYNGIPEDFSSDKVLVNFTDIENETVLPYDKDEYKHYNNYGLVEASEELTEWETFDLRSYLQRPVVNMKAIIEACCNPKNNGGYEVKLDNHFFNPNNPYWADTWMTLPLLTVEGDDTTVYPVANPSLTKRNTNYYTVNGKPADPSLNYTNANVAVRVGCGSTSDLFLRYVMSAKNNFWHNKNIKELIYQQSIFLQLVGYDELGMPVAYSEVIELTSEAERGKNESLSGYSFQDNVPAPKYLTSYGYFHNGKWCDMDGSEQEIVLGLRIARPFSRLEVKVSMPSRYIVDYFGLSKTQTQSDRNKTNITGYTQRTYDINSEIYESDAKARNRVDTSFSINVSEVNYTTSDNSGLHLNVKVSKDKLLKTGVTPCEYLLSYCKIFGLYFYKEPDADIIHIMDRETFYHRDEVMDLEKLIDRSKPMKINPHNASSKWYTFDLEQIESENNNEYLAKYGYNFGSLRFQTNYNFDSSSNELFKDNKLKGGVQTLEKNKYFIKPYQGKYPYYLFNNATMNLFKQGEDDLESEEYKIKKKALIGEPINLQGYTNLDVFHKPQFHTKKHEGTDGSGVLLFLEKSYRHEIGDLKYWLTDDLLEMGTLNDGEACWLMTTTPYHKSVSSGGGDTPEDRTVRIGYWYDSENGSSGYIIDRFPLQFNGMLTITANPELTDGENNDSFSVTRSWRITNGVPSQNGWEDDTDNIKTFFSYYMSQSHNNIDILITEESGWFNIVKTSDMQYRGDVSSWAEYHVFPKSQGGGETEEGKLIAYPIDVIPVFSRYTHEGDVTQTIIHSLDFGIPEIIYEPYTYSTEEQGIFHKFWKNFMWDMYNVDARTLECYCLLNERPNPDWLRRFYWFDNSLWRLNKIKDWNISSFDTTLMEFIKVSDLDNYGLEQVRELDTFRLELASYDIDPAGETVTGKVFVQNGDGWDLGSRHGFTIYDLNGEVVGLMDAVGAVQPYTYGKGNTSISITFPANTYGKDVIYKLILANNESGEWYQVDVRQKAPSQFKVEPTQVYFDDVDATASTVTVTSDEHYTIETD